jgi:hypothetical protein
MLGVRSNCLLMTVKILGGDPRERSGEEQESFGRFSQKVTHMISCLHTSWIVCFQDTYVFLKNLLIDFRGTL